MELPVVDVFRDAIGVVIRLVAPMLLLSMVVGVLEIGRASCRERV